MDDVFLITFIKFFTYMQFWYIYLESWKPWRLMNVFTFLSIIYEYFAVKWNCRINYSAACCSCPYIYFYLNWIIRTVVKNKENNGETFIWVSMMNIVYTAQKHSQPQSPLHWNCHDIDIVKWLLDILYFIHNVHS